MAKAQSMPKEVCAGIGSLDIHTLKVSDSPGTG